MQMRKFDVGCHKSLLMVSVVLGVFLTSGAAGCAPQSGTTDRFIVAVTVLPQAGFVEAVAGDKVEVVVMVPPGASPHTYEVMPEQMVKLSTARMYARVGPPMEFEVVWMDRLISANPDMLVVDCSQGIGFVDAVDDTPEDSHEGESGNGEELVHTGADPHIWLSVRNAQVMVTNICAGLSQVDPENAAYYEDNCTAYVDALQQLDRELADSLSGLANRTFIVYHPAFGYFARDYGLTQLAIEQGGSEPDAQYMVRLIEVAREHDIRVIFVAPQFSSRSAEVVAGEIGGEVVIIDPVAMDYIPNMRAITAAIQQVT
jgi:zinc transport system substrate-binding protein